MAKYAVILAAGFEEIEAVAPIDILRRADVEVTVFGFETVVTGAHQISIQVDKQLDESIFDYDGIILPGGLPGATNLRDNELVTDAVASFDKAGKLVAANCAAPIVLEAAGTLEGQQFVCFPGIEDQIDSGEHLADQLVAVSNHVITGAGPAASFEFAYAILDYIGKDSSKVAEDMQYAKLMAQKASK